jgi:hypothetical protein
LFVNPFADGLITADEPKGLCMNTKNRIFEQTFKGYLAEIAGIDFRWIEAKLGIAAREGCAVIPLLGTDYRVSAGDDARGLP